MKKILILLLFAASLLFASCKAKHIVSAPPPKVEDNTRKAVEGVKALLILHPVENTAQGDNKNYHFMYDYYDKYLHFTDNDAAYAATRDFLPEYITRDSIGHAVILEAVSVHPFSSFTDEVRKKIAASEGIQFEYINNYQIAKAFNLRVETNSLEATQMLYDMLQPSRKQQADQAAIGGRIPVNGAQGLLTYNPIKNPIKGNDNKDYYFFYDYDRKWIYITDDVTIYEQFSKALPLKDNLNAIIVQGISIDPFVFFNKDAIEAMTKDEGLELNGGSNGRDLNKFSVAKLSNYGIVFNYNDVLAEVSKRLNNGALRSNTSYNPDVKPSSSTPTNPGMKPFPSVSPSTAQPSNPQSTPSSSNGRKPAYPTNH